MNFVRVLKTSGLTVIELAALYGVSRQTIYKWSDGHMPREREDRRWGSFYPYQQFERFTAALEKAIDARQLPFPPMDRSLRRARIDKMVTILSNLKPAPARG